MDSLDSDQASFDARPVDPQQSVSQVEFRRLIAVRGEGDEWDFKETLGDLTKTSPKVNLAKDALAFCNLVRGGTLVVGVRKDYTRVGLENAEVLDTTAIRNAVEKYIDGDFTVLAAEYTLMEPGESILKRFGIIHFRRNSMQPVLAALDGNAEHGRTAKFRKGDILVRKGAASIRANSGDVRALLTSSVVQEEIVRSVNTLWSALVEQRRLVGGIETIHDLFTDDECQDARLSSRISAFLGSISGGEFNTELDRLMLSVGLIRPHIPDELYRQYKLLSSFIGRIHWKAIDQRNGALQPWTATKEGKPDTFLREIASQLLPSDAVEAAWNGRETDLGLQHPLRDVIDAAEQTMLEGIRRILSGR